MQIIPIILSESNAMMRLHCKGAVLPSHHGCSDSGTRILLRVMGSSQILAGFIQGGRVGGTNLGALAEGCIVACAYVTITVRSTAAPAVTCVS